MSLWLLAVALAREPGEGVPLRVVVQGPDGRPVRTAVVRHPLEGERHRVNSVDGSWVAEVLYLPDGRELRFQPGTTVEFDVSAPGYEAERVSWKVRRKQNEIAVVLAPLPVDEAPAEEPSVEFGRDVPLEPEAP